MRASDDQDPAAPAGGFRHLQLPFLRACIVDQDSPHCLSRRGEEMIPAVELLWLRHVDEPEVSFMDKRSGLQRLPRFLMRQR